MQYRINLAAAHWRIEKQNEILPRLQDEFERSLNEGTLLALDAGSSAWVADVLEEDAPGD